ncbi:glycosyltransferase [Reichenbachiella sp. MSK19-1]|uniref:glycosyltransferase family 2 protein n=1 Tax=Reichenbachiella sp. MSK19-1 TaxID=1897631 RepID=UPI000E6CED7E|nr:glycosyltransferase [Reichenbachiella sp. MSK19-1]RJE70865.1 hypothetical protein BGP76_08765 [Reichenbachiella sp. MSK19-1]
METLIDILIPTYNRCADLVKNIKGLTKQIKEEHLADKVTIIISDNCSPDDTKIQVEDLMTAHPELSITYFCQAKNIGLEPNVVDLMGRATSPYVMWIGDDDYIVSGYLTFCIQQIEEKQIGCIIPGLSNLYEDGTIIESRLENFEYQAYPAGYNSLFEVSHLAHQMSGLLLNREGLIDRYLRDPEFRNPYLFIFWTADCLYRKGGIYAPHFKTLVSVFNVKDWGYNEVGLLDDVFKSYYFFKRDLTPIQLRELLLRFSKMHSYRYNIKKNEPFKLLKKYNILSTKPPMSLPGFKYQLAMHLIKDYIKSYR